MRYVAKRDIAQRWRACGSPQRNLASSFGFTLLELMIVIVIIMILASVAATSYQRHVVQAREAVLHENVREINKAIQEYTLDKHQAPQSLDDLKAASYFREIPKDPMTNAADWDCDQEEPENAADPQQPGIASCYSHSTGTASSGEAYSSWR